MAGWRGLMVAYVGLGDFNGYSPRADIAIAAIDLSLMPRSLQ